MEEFQFIKPSWQLAPYIKHYWFLKTEATLPEHTRIVPTGYITMLFHREKQIFSSLKNTFQPKAFICGHEKSYDNLIYTGQVDMLVVVFRPLGARSFFNIPMNKVNGLSVSVDDIQDKALTELGKIITNTPENKDCINLIEQFLLKRLYQLPQYNVTRVNTAVNLINKGETDVSTLAGAACLSYKQFQRVFSDNVGANPKEFIRTVRFQRALYLLQLKPDMNLVQLALEAGYYDQSHLIKDFKMFSGYTPLEYLAVCNPFSDYFS